ncbi:MAG: hypothetical protein P1U56_11920 [Saprospiraceae bacterium]|nr:hypothetical protein [Saprospiraceae bacterium]
MTTQEALKIFTPEQIEALSQDTLKVLKKEFLLEYQLTDEAVVTFNGHALDKNSILEIFDQLNGSLNAHLEKHRISIIDNFLRIGDLKYLLNPTHSKRIISGIVSLPKKREKLLFKLSEIIGETLITPSDNREHLLKQILQFTDQLPFDYEEKAYAASFRFLRNEIESIKTRYDNPFYDNFSLKLEPELQTMVDHRFLKLFQLLPEKFHFLAYEYSLWCHEFIIKLTRYREKNYHKYPIDSLLVIQNAALIAAEYYEKEDNLSLARRIKTMLDNPAKLAKNNTSSFNVKNKKRPMREGISPQVWFFIILTIGLALIKILIVNSGTSSKPHRLNYQRPIETTQQPAFMSPQYLSQAHFDSSFKYTGFDGRMMTLVSNKDRMQPKKQAIPDVVVAKASPNPCTDNFLITGKFEIINDLKLIDLQGREVYHWKEPYIKETLVNLPPLKDRTYFIRGNTDSGPVLIELIRELRK